MNYRVELDDGTGNFIILIVDANTQEQAELIAITDINNRPTSDPDQSIVVSSELIINK